VATKSTFSRHNIVCCGTLRAEMQVLREDGFLDAEHVLFTTPGLHERPTEPARQLANRILKAKGASKELIVVYGSKCYVDPSDPLRDIDSLIRERGRGTCGVQANNCVDMLTDAQQREQIASGQQVYWLTPGRVANWRCIFQDWDSGKANETFPQNEKAILLDGIGFFEQYSQDRPEEFLAFSDWMRIPIEPYVVSLDRLGRLLSEQAERCG